MIDAVGDPNTTVTSGYTVTALGDTGTTQNYTLTRLMSIQRGNTEWGKAQFEWFAHPVNTYTFLGWHNSPCITDDLPVATWVTANYYENIAGSTNTSETIYNIDITLTGTWSNDVYVYYDNATNYNSNGTNQSLSPAWPMSCNSGSNNVSTSDYDYNNATNLNYVRFDNSLGSSGAASLQINYFTINADFINQQMQSSGNHSQYICFGIDADNTGSGFALDQTAGAIITTIKFTGGTTGIKTFFNNSEIKVYPNPFSNQLTIENKSELSITKISISDLLGREIMTTNVEHSKEININTQSFDSGVYFVKVFNNSDSYTVKIIKE